jgi:hypothetical protein
VSDVPSDASLWHSVEQTLRTVVLPQLTDEHARSSTVQLIGLARYARTRSTASEAGAEWADQLAQLDARLAEEAVLLDAFRGRLPAEER